MPKVSVIIPTYNRARYICRAINSVLNQTFTDYEIIIVDDGSTDNTREVLAQYGNRIVYLSQSNKGISASRNRGISAAQGEYIAFLDSDDEWLPEKLTIQVDMLDKNERLGLACSRMLILDSDGKQRGYKPEERTGRNFRELIEIGGDLPTSTVMTRKACFDKVGVFDETLPPMEDFEMWVRIASRYDIYMMPEKVLAYYYTHDHQITKNTTLVYEATVKLDKKILSRHRHMPGFPAKTVCRKIASSEYVLSRIYYKEKQYEEAFGMLCDAMRNSPLIGMRFVKKNETLAGKIVKLFKPYGYFLACFMRKCCSAGKR